MDRSKSFINQSLHSLMSIEHYKLRIGLIDKYDNQS